MVDASSRRDIKEQSAYQQFTMPKLFNKVQVTALLFTPPSTASPAPSTPESSESGVLRTEKSEQSKGSGPKSNPPAKPSSSSNHLDKLHSYIIQKLLLSFMSLSTSFDKDQNVKFSNYYHFQSVIGKGAFAVVVSAIDLATHQLCAVKVPFIP